ncbi:glutaredoxin family protein [Bacillus sp. FJAT-47783]|uniref:glutaredoxin family protein n=1 Tax=Bacillus sp. FJAT-47783 TaxID=2922712 RepID=UPI001FADB65F|nr:glutaredoxin family protein [Bacillus sp. FJAT-47783]
MNIKLYTKEGCTLCDEAMEVLTELQESFALHIEEIDIYKDDSLLEKYQLMIPVIEMDRKILQYGKIDKIFLRKRLLEQTNVD